MINRIFLPVRTVAEWGGVHEWVLTAVQDLRSIGVEVLVAGRSGLFKERMLSAGADYYELDWDTWYDHVSLLAELYDWDLVFSHGPLARNLGVEVGRRTGKPVHHMIHGAYLDQVNDWSPQVESVIAASPSVFDLVVRVGKVEPWKVSVVPNGVPDAVFDLTYKDLQTKLAGGSAKVVTAARLAPDKLHQIGPTIRLMTDLAHYRDDIHWTLEVMGDGPMRDHFLSEFADGLGDISNVSVDYLGWTDPEEVPRRMNEAVAACVAGMGGVRALAAGTLALGVGAQGSVGLQFGRNLMAGIWSNFGDHGCPRFSPSDQTEDLKFILETNSYDLFVEHAREACRLHRSASTVRSSMYSALGLTAIDRLGSSTTGM